MNVCQHHTLIGNFVTTNQRSMNVLVLLVPIWIEMQNHIYTELCSVINFSTALGYLFNKNVLEVVVMRQVFWKIW